MNVDNIKKDLGTQPAPRLCNDFTTAQGSNPKALTQACQDAHSTYQAGVCGCGRCGCSPCRCC